MSEKKRKRHIRTIRICAFCNTLIEGAYSVLGSGVIICPECMENIMQFASEVGEVGTYGYKTTDGKTGYFTLGTW